MALIGLFIASSAVGCLSNAAFGCLTFGSGLIAFRIFDCIYNATVCNAGSDEE